MGQEIFVVHYVDDRDSDTGHSVRYYSEIAGAFYSKEKADELVQALRKRTVFAGITIVEVS